MLLIKLKFDVHVIGHCNTSCIDFDKFKTSVLCRNRKKKNNNIFKQHNATFFRLKTRHTKCRACMIPIFFNSTSFFSNIFLPESPIFSFSFFFLPAQFSCLQKKHQQCPVCFTYSLFLVYCHLSCCLCKECFLELGKSLKWKIAIQCTR